MTHHIVGCSLYSMPHMLTSQKVHKLVKAFSSLCKVCFNAPLYHFWVHLYELLEAKLKMYAQAHEAQIIC